MLGTRARDKGGVALALGKLMSNTESRQYLKCNRTRARAKVGKGEGPPRRVGVNFKKVFLKRLFDLRLKDTNHQRDEQKKKKEA